MSVIRTKALILRHTTDREHDRILTILTPTLGQQRVRARGTKKSVSKLGGSLEPLMEVDLTLANGRVTDLVTGSVILNRWPELRQDVVAMTMAQWLMELVEAVTKPGQAVKGLYDLVKQALTEMGREISWPAGRRWLALDRRAFAILVHEGFAPTMDSCSLCHRPLNDREVVHHPQQGFVHASEAQVGAFAIEPATVNYLRAARPPALTRAVFRQTHELLERLIHQTLDRPLKSERVLRAVVRLGRLPTGGSAS